MRHGKTAAARRMLPITPRVRAVLEMRWERARKPAEGWIFPAPTVSGHIDHTSLKKQHASPLRSCQKNKARDLGTGLSANAYGLAQVLARPCFTSHFT